MSSRLEELAKSRFEYKECMLDGSMAADGVDHNKLSKKVHDMLMKQLHFIASIECTAADRLMKMIRKSPMVCLDKQQLMCSLNDKMDLGAIGDSDLAAAGDSGLAASGSGGPSPDAIVIVSSVKKAKTLQEHRSIHNYGPEQLRKGICDKAVPMEVKMQVMAAFLKTRGVRYIAEKTAG